MENKEEPHKNKIGAKMAANPFSIMERQSCELF